MFDVVDPSNREVFHKIACGTKQDIDAVVRAACDGFDYGPWSRLSETAHVRILRRMGDEITRRPDELARLEVRDTGKSLP